MIKITCLIHLHMHHIIMVLCRFIFTGWGFKRLLQSGMDFNAFYHESFLRDRPHLVVLLKRVEPNKGKLLPHVEGEPNFVSHRLFCT